MKSKSRLVFTVLYFDPSAPNDGRSTHMARFRDRQAAARFAADKQHYGGPASYVEEIVPAHIADRWEYWG